MRSTNLALDFVRKIKQTISSNISRRIPVTHYFGNEKGNITTSIAFITAF